MDDCVPIILKTDIISAKDAEDLLQRIREFTNKPFIVVGRNCEVEFPDNEKTRRFKIWALLEVIRNGKLNNNKRNESR